MTRFFLGLAFGGSLAFDPVAFVLGLAADEFLFLALALIGLADAGIGERPFAGLALVGRERAEHHARACALRRRGTLCLVGRRLRHARLLLEGGLCLRRRRGGLVIAKTLALRLDDNGLGAAMGEALLHPRLLHRRALERQRTAGPVASGLVLVIRCIVHVSSSDPNTLKSKPS